MKELFIGFVLGSIAIWGWYHTGGKISITETKTVTNEVVVAVTVTQVVEQLAYQYITRTNEIWKTNIVEQIAKVQKPLQTTPRPIQAVQQPATVQPVQTQITQPVQQKKNSEGLRGARPAGKIKDDNYFYDQKIKNTGIKRDLSGNIKQTNSPSR